MTVGLRLMLEPQQGGTYEQFLALALASEAAGFEALFRSDHLLTIGPGDPVDALEAWTTLAGLARDTTRLRLGTLVSPFTFRHPAVLARAAATVDHLSNGRCELGVGAGWFEDEHHAFGFPLPPIADRMSMLDEGASAVRALLDGGPVTVDGAHFTLRNAVSLPRPVQRRLPIIVGGRGGRRSAALAARLADEYNMVVPSPDDVARGAAAAHAACERNERDPLSLTISWMGTCVVAGDEDDLRRRCTDVLARSGVPGVDGAEAAERVRARGGVVGTYAEAASRMRELVAAGCGRIYLRVLTLDDPEMVLEVAEEVAPLAA